MIYSSKATIHTLPSAPPLPSEEQSSVLDTVRRIRAHIDTMQQMLLSIIVAASDNNVIGQGDKLPWDLPYDRQYFREMTRGKPVIMGRKTFESILGYFGGPMPGRVNIVVTRDPHYAVPTGVKVIDDLEKAIFLADETLAEAYANATREEKEQMDREAFIIGGGEIYKQAMRLPDPDYLYLTRVHAELPVTDDTVFFPAFDEEEWDCRYCEDHPADERHQYAFTMCLYKKKKPELDDDMD